MTLTHNDVLPSGTLAPMVAAGFGEGEAPQPPDIRNPIILAPLASDGSATAGDKHVVGSVAAAEEFFGKASFAAEMVAWWLAKAPLVPISVIGIDDSAATGSTWSVDFTGITTLTASGTAVIRAGGRTYRVEYTSADGDTDVAQRFETLVGLDPYAKFTASESAGDVTLTSKAKGAAVNEMMVTVNHLGAAAGEVSPGGFAVTVTPANAGANNPSIATALATMGDDIHDLVICAYNDDANLNLAKTWLEDRWSATKMVDGRIIAPARGAGGVGTKSARVSDLASSTRDGKHESILAVPMLPDNPWAILAQAMAATYLRTSGLVSLPPTDLELPSVLPATPANRLSYADREALLQAGISTLRESDQGVVVDRLVTTSDDAPWKKWETPGILSVARRRFVEAFTSEHVGTLSAPDGTTAKPGVPMSTPKLVKATDAATYRELVSDGYLVEADDAIEQMVVTRAAGRFNHRVPLYLVDQVYQGAFIFEFSTAA